MLSEHLFFVTERITDILKLEQEKEIEYPDAERKGILAFPLKLRKQRIKKSFQELHDELSRVVVYLRHVEQGRDGQHQDHNKLYLELLVIADSSDDILNRFISDDVVVNDICDGFKSIVNCLFGNDITTNIYHLADRIRYFHLNLPSGPSYNFITGGNTNLSGKQIIGSTTINIDPSHSRALMTNRISRPKTYDGDYPHSDLVGFKREIQTLLHHLTQDNETCVVGIVGMGGLGKTTLEKHVYNQSKIKTHFTHQIWVCISESWDKTTILNEICTQVIPGNTIKGYDQIIRSLSEKLRNESYLLVIDDMRSIDAWNHISQAFPPLSGRSKVVVTSRNIVVPQQFDGVHHIVEPKPLDDKQSWELFKKKAFLPQNISAMQLQLGEEMVKECEGLPLAIVALAGILRMGRTKRYWERVRKTLTHRILEANNHSTQGIVKEVLALSYRELPNNLKQCVLYLRFFPEDYEINARNVMKMWIAEGLITTTKDQEITAEKYLDEIVQRYIVKVVKTNFMGQVSRIRIHDLIRQMLVDTDKERGFLRDSLRLDSSTALYVVFSLLQKGVITAHE